MNSITESFAFRNRRRLGFVLSAPIVVLFLFSYPVIDENSLLGIFFTLLGWLVFGLYVTLRLWSILFIGARKDSELQSEGPYSMTRNPLYLGTFCYALSGVLILKSITLAIVVCVRTLFYSQFVVRAEERFLEEKFGDKFRNYLVRTPRFLPVFARFHSPDSVHISLAALRVEAKRLWRTFLFPVTMEIMMQLRMSPHWPHWFRLP
jgi:protein-S-isoprenylcysteine O-methyltransferase Ste14